MNYTVILFISTLLLNSYKLEELCSIASEVEKKHATILEGNDLESLAEKAEKKSLYDGSLLILKTLKTPIYITIQKNTEERKKSISLLKKFTESYGKNEFKPFTYFIDCIEKEQGEIIILFGNFGESLNNFELARNFKDLSLSKQLENGSSIFNFISRLTNFNRKLFMKFDIEKILFKTVNDKLVPIVILIDNIFEKKAPVPKRATLVAPEENKKGFSYLESMVYDAFIFYIFLIENISRENDKDNNINISDYIRANADKDKNEFIISYFEKCIKEADLHFVEPNIFIKFWYAIESLFIDNSVNRSYSLDQLVPLALNYDKNQRPNIKDIANKLLYFSKNLIEEKVKSKSVKIIL